MGQNEKEIMKPITQMTLAECLEEFVEQRQIELYGFASTWRQELADRIHDLTRWIPVSERMPEEEDGDEHGNVLGFATDGNVWIPHFKAISSGYGFTHWKSIIPPEDEL